MRNRLTGVAVLAFLPAVACGGGTTIANGTVGGGTGTGGGTTAGERLSPGEPCTANSQCSNGACGLDGTGNCCAAACSTSDSTCGATGCDATGACSYPDNLTPCGSDSCKADLLGPRTCNGAGTCIVGATLPCLENLGCNLAATACNTSCASTTDCASGYVCNATACVAPVTVGACTENDDCLSNRCGLDGTGHCCVGATSCVTGDPICGATDCDPTSGNCDYADAGTACGSLLASCSSGTQQDPSVCDGEGTCPVPATVACTPFVCGAAACLATCQDSTSCVSGDFCELGAQTCCDALPSGGTITVDATLGNDAAPCCSLGGHVPCQTIHHAMTLIDEARAQNVTIKAVVRNGSTWNSPDEVYPIVLGWGAELSAPGIFFSDPNDGGSEIIDIDNFSANDTVGYASIVGTAGKVVTIGPDELMDQTLDTSMIQVEAGNTLYIANAEVNGSYETDARFNYSSTRTTAITVTGGGSLVFGQDQSASVTGTVTIGNALNDLTSDGWKGVVCGVANGKGCTISDAILKGGTSSVVIQGQVDSDIDAEDYAVISLSSHPVIGIPPASAGFQQCPENFNGSSYGKPDVSASPGGLDGAHGAAVLLHGLVSMTFNNGIVQCISGDAFDLTATKNGTPTLTIDNTTIQNTEYGVNAAAGTATVTSSTIWYNYNGVQQGTDGTNISTIDLSSGGDGGLTTVVCSNSYESVGGQGVVPGVSVLNSTSKSLNAQNVDWDTSGPDLFSCDATMVDCACDISGCTLDVSQGGIDGMDAVQTSSGVVDTSGNGQSPADCTVPGGGGCGAGCGCG